MIKQSSIFLKGSRTVPPASMFTTELNFSLTLKKMNGKRITYVPSSFSNVLKFPKLFSYRTDKILLSLDALVSFV